jgi:methionyl-tRNA synthetase
MADAPTPTPTPTPAPAAAPAAPATIDYNDFAKIELRVATIVEAKLHPKADKLLVLQIDVGNERRQICAGIRADYTPEQLIGKQIVVVANLAPRPLRGEISNGMLLAATDAATGKVVLLGPQDPVAAGSKVK